MISRAIDSIKEGKPILIFDAEGREEETDIVFASQYIDDAKVRFMRKEGGGLICTTLPFEIARKIGLPYLHEIFEHSDYEIFKYLTKRVKYDALPAFSVTINHIDNYTGISDRERAKTIREFAEFIRGIDYFKNIAEEFGRRFISPGHVHLLISSGLDKRRGHTELSTAIVTMAGLVPSATIVEMLGDHGYSLTKREAKEYAEKMDLVFIEGYEIVEAWERWSE